MPAISVSCVVYEPNQMERPLTGFAPPPSHATPLMLRLACVTPLPSSYSTIGDPAQIEQFPEFGPTVEQLVFEDPGPTESYSALIPTAVPAAFTNCIAGDSGSGVATLNAARPTADPTGGTPFTVDSSGPAGVPSVPGLYAVTSPCAHPPNTAVSIAVVSHGGEN